MNRATIARVFANEHAEVGIWPKRVICNRVAHALRPNLVVECRISQVVLAVCLVQKRALIATDLLSQVRNSFSLDAAQVVIEFANHDGTAGTPNQIGHVVVDEQRWVLPPLHAFDGAEVGERAFWEIAHC